MTHVVNLHQTAKTGKFEFYAGSLVINGHDTIVLIALKLIINIISPEGIEA